MAAALQAAGHDGARQDAGLFIKPTTQQELLFYEWIVHEDRELSAFVPLFMGTLTEKGFEGEQEASPDPARSGRSLIVLEDLCQGFDDPSIIDVKLGSQLWDTSASPEKRTRLQQVSDTTTSGSLGFRIAGMTIVNASRKRQAYGKQFGRAATASTIDDHLLEFWPNLSSNDYIFSALVSAIAQLEQLYDALSKECLELHSASVLILYEGNLDTLQKKASGDFDGRAEPHRQEHEHEQGPDGLGGPAAHEGSSDDDDGGAVSPKLVDVRLIDFAHTKQASKPDEDVLRGLSELISAFKRLRSRVES